MNSILLSLKIRRFLALLSDLDRVRFTRWQEDLCIVLSHPDYRPLLPKVFPGITGEHAVSFETTRRISRGNPHAMLGAVSRMVRNELRVNPGKDIHRIITQILESAEALCEHGYELGGGQISERIGGFIQNENERKAVLNAIIGNGVRRITVDDYSGESFPLRSQNSPSSIVNSSSPMEDGRKGFFRNLGEGKNALDAAVSASLLSRELVEFGRGIVAFSGAISEWRRKHPAARKPIRRKGPIGRGGAS